MSAGEPLAKTHPRQTLSEHTQQVWEAAEAMARALQLPPPLQEALRHAVWLHDVGKAAKGFQRMLRGEGSWGHRHELLSGAIALAVGAPEEAVLAILTHHRPLNDDAVRGASGAGMMALNWQRHGLSRWRALLSELEEQWQWLNQFLQERGYPPLPDSPADLPALRELLARHEKTTMKRLPAERRKQLVLLRGVLIAADHLASGHQTVPPPLPQPQWSYSWYPFQRQTAQMGGDVFVEAPTGSGKTEAAFLWALHNRRGEARIFYVLPTQASINAMVERLRRPGAFGERAVAPVHARVLQQEFQMRFHDEGNYQQAAQDARARADLYRQFYAPVKVLTPFQIIKHLFGQGYFEVGLAELQGALLVVDEVHAYDSRVQALLESSLRYLREEFGVRLCFMSATFPSFLKERLRRIAPEAGEVSAYGEAVFERPRHRLRLLDLPLEECAAAIRNDLAQGKRVLVVCNRVAQAQAIYQQFADVESCRLLHSRFTYRDRGQIEREVLDENTRPQLLVATQVVEVSLDIDYDTCYTEVAPVDDLLQRFGRVNRRGKAREPAWVCVCTQYDVEQVKWVYDPERL
ncbi:MAG: CRISPR-associated helicase Cas3', partial [Armatimonadota bacterium]|nr:CRISPR-associated helicase Cas3' [Armatimonadota bacterium]